jgi:glycosyltransferase involved in cell wall biosynthesis
MSDSRPLISIVIPTRERAATLEHTLRSALKQSATSYEVLVSDNASQDRTPATVAALSDSRIRYVRAEQRLSMCENWEFALTHVRGQYVMYIGDDDAVMPNGIDRLIELMAVRPSRAYLWPTPIYTWPIDGQSPEVTYIPRLQSQPHELDLVRMARFVMRYGGWRYYAIPGVYHALVEREVLHAIRRATGRVFRSTQPDLITSMSVPAFTQRAVHTGFPVTVHGRSARSNAASLIARQGRSGLQRYIEEFGEYRVHPSLCPDMPRYANLVVDAILLARDAFPELYGATAFNYDAMLAFLCRSGWVSKSVVLSHSRRLRRYHPFNPLRFIAYSTFFESAAVRRSVLNWISRRTQMSNTVPDNVYDFACQYDQWVRRSKHRMISAAASSNANPQSS